MIAAIRSMSVGEEGTSVYLYTSRPTSKTMGFDGHPIDRIALDPVQDWMTALSPTRDKPTAVRYRDTIVVYWQENGAWVAREFGRPSLLPMSDELAKVIEADQRHAREKLLD